jgi:hypothetical protein
MCEDFAPNFGDKKAGCYITTTHRLTLPFPPGNFFYQKTTWLSSSTHDFSLFIQLKINLKGRHFDTLEVNEAESQAVPNTLTERYFQDAFKKWHKHWEWCTHIWKGATLRVMVASRPKVSF